MSQGRFTISNFNDKFKDDNACLEHLFKLFHGKDPEFAKYYRVNGRKCFAHSETGHQIHPLANTIFHKSRTPLKDWFYIVFLFSCSRNGISSYEISRQIGVTHKCAWRMAKQIRKLFETTGFYEKLGGTVEMDETYVGGKRQGKRGRGAEGKTPVVGIVERQGEVRATVTTNTKSSTLMPLLQENVTLGSTVMTDEYRPYNKVAKHGFNHGKVIHGVGQYVSGDAHTNTLEGFWSQMKRAIDGTHHMVSPKYLQAYVDEFTWKYNQSRSHVHIFETLITKFKKYGS